MNKLKKDEFVRIEVIILLFLILAVPIAYVLSDTLSLGEELEKTDDGYKIYVRASQWTYRVYDLNALDVNADEFQQLGYQDIAGYELDNPKLQVKKNAELTIYLVSRDVSHGLRFDSINFQLVAERPDAGIEFGPVVNGTITVPTQNHQLNGYNPIDAGLGTDQMTIEIHVGNPHLWTNIFLSLLFTGLVVILVTYTLKIISIDDHE